MKAQVNYFKRLTAALSGLALLCAASTEVRALVEGVSGAAFSLSAKAGYISTPDGDSLLIWGYAEGGNAMQYPGPTLIVDQGQTVTITLSNNLPGPAMPVSIVFPGQQGVTASGGSPGLLTQESTGPGDVVTYTFDATHAGTYMYHSGTRAQLQIEMGLVGAIIVRPATAGRAYEHADTAFDREHLFVLTEMDPNVHHLVEAGQLAQLDNTTYNPVLWFINGRNAPDTMAPSFAPWLPHQPYSSLAQVHPGEKLLLRVVGASRNLHPFHTHGNNIDLIASDGRLLQSAPGAGPDLARSDFTLKVVPGQTYDGLWQWTGKGLGWDIYGTLAQGGIAHTCTDNNSDGFDDTTVEWCADHGKPLPVILPELQSMTFGGFYSGSPFLGVLSSLPPGEGGLNLNGGLFFMWHSHTERELVNNDVFPGGMMTMLIVEPPGTPIP